jgi:hypothetical protein
MRISDVHSMMVSVYNDWGGFLANPRYIRRGDEITWAERTPHFLKGTIQHGDVLGLIETGQYSFQTSDDGSIIQLHYEFEQGGAEVKAASLGYFAAPPPQDDSGLSSQGERGQIPDSEDAGITDGSEGTRTETSQYASWLRIDFSPTTAGGVLHHDCHLHVSGFPASRLVVKRLPTPKQFVEFVIALCHPNVYTSQRLDHTGGFVDATRMTSVNTPAFTCEDNDLYAHMMHLATPGS